jgi:putative transposase
MIGRVRLKETLSQRGFEGRILSATITRRANRWFVSLAVEREREVALPRPLVSAGDVVGVDLGLKAAAVIHDGATTRVIEPQQALRKNMVRLHRLDRQLARKQRASRNREDFLHQLSSTLARTKSVIVLEDLHVKGMQRNRSLALSVSDAGMGALRRLLAYKCEWYGSRLIVADRFFPSSKTCSGCGLIKEALGLGERVFACHACDLSLDRDENAAINLHGYGLQAVGGELGIAPLPEGLREVTPVGEEGSGLERQPQVKPASVKQEATTRRTSGTNRRSMPKGVLDGPKVRRVIPQDPHPRETEEPAEAGSSSTPT